MEKDEYCEDCIHREECKGSALHNGDCESGGPYASNIDYGITF